MPRHRIGIGAEPDRAIAVIVQVGETADQIGDRLRIGGRRPLRGQRGQRIEIEGRRGVGRGFRLLGMARAGGKGRDGSGGADG